MQLVLDQQVHRPLHQVEHAADGISQTVHATKRGEAKALGCKVRDGSVEEGSEYDKDANADELQPGHWEHGAHAKDGAAQPNGQEGGG